jgi:pimeloyl-ACP methyl ester carboxylesterase
MLVLAGTVLVACGSPAASDAGASSSAATTSSTASTATTTTTTTTLPLPILVPGTRAAGSLSSFGPVERIPVTAVPDGATLPPAPPPGALVPPAGSVELAFRQFGSGPDLLLVPGEHSTMSWWDPQLLTDLAQHYTVTVFDLPGTGYSGPDPAVTSVESIADSTAGLIAGLGLKTPVVLGWGLGAEVALSLTERHPGLVARLALVDGSAGGPSGTPPASAVAGELASPTATQFELSGLLFPPALTAARTGWLARIAALPPDDLVKDAIAQEAAVQASAWSDTSVASGLAKVTVRSLVVTGSLDEIFPPANAAVLVAGLRHSHELVLPGAGYASISQDEPQFVAALETFTG